ncbi:MAG: plastocyanin/azurin family copper-binding protein [Candidatus Limnocylindrales bacterium]
MPMRKVVLLVVITAAALALAACGGPATSAPAAAPAASAAPGGSVAPAGRTAAATIVDFGFTPASLTVTVGTTVTWTNTGTVSHTVTADDGSFDSGTLASGATYKHTFSKAGTYAYHCSIHPSMVARVVYATAARPTRTAVGTP